MEMLETLLDSVRSACAAFPDPRRGAVTYSMADIGLSAFSLFFMQSESFLFYQRGLEEGRKREHAILWGSLRRPMRLLHRCLLGGNLDSDDGRRPRTYRSAPLLARRG